MPSFSKEQKQIAAFLLREGPRTAEEISESLSISLPVVTDTLRMMLKLRLADKGGAPTRYSLHGNIVEEVSRRKKLEEEDTNKLRIRGIVEIQAITQELVQEHLDKLGKSLSSDKNYLVYSLEKAPIEKMESNDYYSSFLDVNFSVKTFSALVRFMIFFGPISVEVIKPDKITFPAQDLQDGLIDLSDMVQGYTEYITKLMNRQELESFNRELHKK
ncbi:MAG: hypothetical protein HY394_05815 [Candidatus Diapherotrites archaeon]|nr:hypothetical protein [Candidatus Diapherotrites archaeon]